MGPQSNGQLPAEGVAIIADYANAIDRGVFFAVMDGSRQEISAYVGVGRVRTRVTIDSWTEKFGSRWVVMGAIRVELDHCHTIRFCKLAKIWPIIDRNVIERVLMGFIAPGTTNARERIMESIHVAFAK